ncbi:hypothetical protein CAEBREN_16601 [Caenorhabditis brenneri]|uniref:Uncharacterized protein n=1 Tax=Caenorhabditis brenneri TaxID=135651 RepID=G0NYQ1_CAEBE|nr:hypothetical protein CAEBREN_16601 [Caenorhabditis brenneri]
MRNYYMAEIHEFHYKFRKFFEFREDGNGLNPRVACNCRQQICRSLVFEPRYGCANCTNNIRKHKSPADKLCLLCSTQKEIARRLKSAEKSTFDSENLENIKNDQTTDVRHRRWWRSLNFILQQTAIGQLEEKGIGCSLQMQHNRMGQVHSILKHIPFLHDNTSEHLTTC